MILLCSKLSGKTYCIKHNKLNSLKMTLFQPMEISIPQQFMSSNPIRMRQIIYAKINHEHITFIKQSGIKQDA